MAILGHIEEFRPESASITTYLERVELFFIVNKVEDDRMVAVLLSLVGSKTYDTSKNLVAPDTPQSKSFNNLQKTLIDHYQPKPITIAERFHFHNWNHAEYVAELKRLAATCNFKIYLPEALRDRFVCGFNHLGMQKKLLAEKDLSFEKAVEIAQAVESAEKQINEIKKDTATIAKVKREPTGTNIGPYLFTLWLPHLKIAVSKRHHVIIVERKAIFLVSAVAQDILKRMIKIMKRNVKKVGLEEEEGFIFQLHGTCRKPLKLNITINEVQVPIVCH